jgi:hypothetical protein
LIRPQAANQSRVFLGTRLFFKGVQWIETTKIKSPRSSATPSVASSPITFFFEALLPYVIAFFAILGAGYLYSEYQKNNRRRH